jgi:cytidine deaminase
MSLAGGYDAEQLLEMARLAAQNAYAPYSQFPVGAALLTADGEAILGVNVENVSYGLTLCAERSAVARAVSEGRQNFVAIAVWATVRPYGAVTPCGACRQVLAEFMTPDGMIILADETTGAVKTFTMKALLPEAFGPDGSCLGKGSSKRVD